MTPTDTPAATDAEAVKQALLGALAEMGEAKLHSDVFVLGEKHPLVAAITALTPQAASPDGLREEDALRELGLLYNYRHDDGEQFTRWQMAAAICHGHRLALATLTEPPSEVVRLRERIKELEWIVSGGPR